MDSQTNDRNKIEYFELYQSESLPIHFAPWWLDAVCGPKDWGVVLAKNPDNGIEGVMPYHLKKKFGFRIILMPQLTAYGGIWLIYPVKLKSHSKISFEKKTIDKLLNGLPKYALFYQQLHPNHTNSLPFFWRSFSQSTRYTYLLNLDDGLDKIWDNFKGNIRRNVRKAEDSGYTVEETQAYDLFTQALKKSYAARRKEVPFNMHIFSKIELACRTHKARKMFVCKNRNGDILAGVYLIYDKECAYYLVGFFDPAHKDYAGLTLCLWKGIQHMSEIVNRFDFEGSIIPEIEFYFRAFGGTLTPHHKIFKAKNALVKFLARLKNPQIFE